MITVDGDVIKLTRGDTETLQAVPKDAEGNPYVLQDGEYIEFCLKKHSDDSEVLIRKTSTDGNFSFTRANNGTLTVRRRYNGTYSLTVNSDYRIDVYKLVPPTGMVLFE